MQRNRRMFRWNAPGLRVAAAGIRPIALSVWLGVAAWAGAPLRAENHDWPTLHGNLPRHGFYPGFPRGDLKLAWRKELHDELTGPRCEVIVAGGLAFMGTYAGRMYAWDAATGLERWRFDAEGAIGHSPAYDHGGLYFGALDGRLYCLDAASGKKRWTFDAGEGFWSSPAVSGGRLFAGARNGVFYALDAAGGQLLWQHQTGARIVSSAAVTADGNRVLVASEDMHLYCFDAPTGRLVWRSIKLHGLSMRDYFPVIARDLVFVATNPAKDFHTLLDEHQKMLVAWSGFDGKDSRYIPGTPARVAEEQKRIVTFLREHPEEQTFYAFRVEDGSVPWIAPVLYSGGLHNPLTPPCYNPVRDELYLFVRSAYGIWDGGGEVRPLTSPGKLDWNTGSVELIEHGYPSKEPGRPPGSKDMPWMTFNVIGDEAQALSSSPDQLFSNHQGYLGAMDFESGLCRNLFGKRDTYGGFYGPGTFGWENQGGYEKARAAGQPFGLVNEWHGPARAIVSVARGRVYYPAGSQVLCLEAR